MEQFSAAGRDGGRHARRVSSDAGPPRRHSRLHKAAGRRPRINMQRDRGHPAPEPCTRRETIALVPDTSGSISGSSPLDSCAGTTAVAPISGQRATPESRHRGGVFRTLPDPVAWGSAAKACLRRGFGHLVRPGRQAHLFHKVESSTSSPSPRRPVKPGLCASTSPSIIPSHDWTLAPRLLFRAPRWAPMGSGVFSGIEAGFQAGAGLPCRVSRSSPTQEPMMKREAMPASRSPRRRLNGS